MSANPSTVLVAREDRIIGRASAILERRFTRPRGPQLDFLSARKLAAMKLSRYQREVMIGIWMDAQMHVIAIEEFGAGNATTVHIYPREIVKSALRHNAVRLILAHNHPGGGLEFSDADLELTAELRKALKLVDVQIDDHLLVGKGVASLTEIELMERLRQESESQPKKAGR